MSLQQFVSVTSDGKIWHAIRNATDGSWTRFGDVKAATGTDPGQFTSVACASSDEGLHVSGSTTDGKMWHAIRNATNGSWTPLRDVKAATGSDPGQIVAVGMGYL